MNIWPLIETAHCNGGSTCIYFNKKMFTFFCRVNELKEYDSSGFELWWPHEAHPSYYCAGMVATDDGSWGKELIL